MYTLSTRMGVLFARHVLRATLKISTTQVGPKRSNYVTYFLRLVTRNLGFELDSHVLWNRKLLLRQPAGPHVRTSAVRTLF